MKALTMNLLGTAGFVALGGAGMLISSYIPARVSAPGTEIGVIQGSAPSPEVFRVAAPTRSDGVPRAPTRPGYLTGYSPTESTGKVWRVLDHGGLRADVVNRRTPPWDLPPIADLPSTTVIATTAAVVPSTTVTTTTAAVVPSTTVTTTTAAVVPSTTVTTTTAAGGERPVVMADASTVLDRPNTIYDFGFGSPGDVVIAASNVEARNIRGGGARRIGVAGGSSITDSGFRNFEFTYANIQMSKGGNVVRPYFIDGTDVNPQPNIGDGDIVQIFAYDNGDIIDPLIDGLTIYGKKLAPGGQGHNDGIQFTGIRGGRIFNPTIRNSTILGASSSAVQARYVFGLFTIEGSTLSRRFESWYAVIAKAEDSNSSVLWRNNTLLPGSDALFRGGWSVDMSSNGLANNVIIP